MRWKGALPCSGAGENEPMNTRTLLVLRHAKSAHPERIADIDRPLTPRGRDDARAAGAWLRLHGYRPDLVLCSPARRARETCEALGLTDSPTRYDRSLYEASEGDLLSAVTETDDAVGVLMLIGHNPGLSYLCALLDPEGVGTDLRTNGIAVHEADRSWLEWSRGTARLAKTHTARADD
jgi:phosphohistidine phosphatase